MSGVSSYIDERMKNRMKKAVSFNRKSSLKAKSLIDRIDVKLQAIDDAINELKIETNNADTKIKDYCHELQTRIKEGKKNFQKQLKLLVKHKYSQMKISKDKYNEIKDYIETNGVTGEIEGQLDILINDTEINTDLYVNYNDSNIDNIINSVVIADYKVKIKNNDVQSLKSDNKALKHKLKEMKSKVDNINKYKNDIETLRQTLQDISNKHHIVVPQPVIETKDDNQESEEMTRIKAELNAIKQQNTKLTEKNKTLKAKLKKLLQLSGSDHSPRSSASLIQSATELIDAKQANDSFNKLPKPEELNNKISQQTNEINEYKEEISGLKNEIKRMKESHRNRTISTCVISGDLYKFKGYNVNNIKNIIPKHKKYCVYSPQLKLLSYADNRIEFNKHNIRHAYVTGVTNNDNEISKRLPPIFNGKWFKIDCKEDKTERIIVFGSDNNESINWYNKIHKSIN